MKTLPGMVNMSYIAQATATPQTGQSGRGRGSL